MSYTQIVTTLPGRINDNTEFQVWGQTVHDALANMGLVQTGDSGQVTIGSASKPGSGSSFAGYEIWRFADALQATAPVFFKLEYGTSQVATIPALRIQFGTGSNGSGTLTGPTSTQMTVGMGNAASANLHHCLFCGDTGRFAMAMFFFSASGGSVSRAMFLGAEREKDANGNDVGTGVLISGCASNQGFSAQGQQELFDRTLGGQTIEGGWGIMFPTIGNGVNGSDIAVFPHYHQRNLNLPAGLNGFGYFHTSIAVNSQITIPIYGGNHNYYALGNTFVNNGTFLGRTGNPSSNCTFLVRFE